ncbi:hypothetical protein M011DRAFT_11937 [Sporormia fimetaria CBS 119925]|uniref:Uncharacterized protein n=1 Tax=Sporormia fimetaria CBS 119925 TaxID=1340428 RepID=A0A6A6VP78_9PLEO|nr:hypothetical protein M011DRAFT_11937 [Sporormia fimetaria CBS 119925]
MPALLSWLEVCRYMCTTAASHPIPRFYATWAARVPSYLMYQAFATWKVRVLLVQLPIFNLHTLRRTHTLASQHLSTTLLTSGTDRPLARLSFRLARNSTNNLHSKFFPSSTLRTRVQHGK